MKKHLIPLICFLFVVGCQESLFRPTGEFLPKETTPSIKGSFPDLGTNVSMKDMEAYLHFKELGYGQKAESVKPVSEGDDTLFYIVNYDKGWELIAGDKRAPVLLASGEEGSFSMETENVEMLFWIDCLASEVKSLKHMEDFSSCSEEELENMQSSRRFWGLVCCEIEYITTLPTRGHDDSIGVIPIGGHYELRGVSHSTELLDDIKLTQTHWHQNSYYNLYCPLKTISDDDPRAPAGCIAIAGAQMLYFLHNKLSVPVNAPDTAFCVGYVGLGNYVQTYGGSSSSTWSYMLYNSINEKGFRAAAVLIACIGKKIGMSYGNDGSIASLSSLKNYAFIPFGYDCDYGTYSSSTTKQNLIDGFPVVLLGFESNNSDIGHCFLIDGYRRYIAVHTYQYEWVWDEPQPGPPFFNYPPHNVVTYGSPYITDYRMNWGWGASYDSGYYSVSGNWIVDGDNYIYDRKMICNFSVI
ncbi:MAG: C10 family peptidase [Bacteroidales bacterium]|nr:C10 family peptidase [Bacteroidales bacterium]